MILRQGWLGALGLGGLVLALVVGGCRTTKTVEKKVEAKPTAGVIDIKVTPDTARVTVDGQPAGQGSQGPFALGPHTVRAEAPGYQPLEQVVTLDGPQATVALVLVTAATTGTLQMVVNVPADCEAADNHAAAAPGHPGSLSLKPGLLELQCRAEGYSTAVVLTRVRAGETTTETLKLISMREPKSGLEGVPLHGGSMHVGCAKGDAACGAERPEATVSVRAFSIGKTEVTVEAYGKCVKSGFCAEPKAGKKHDKSDCTWGTPLVNNPINCVSWTQASDFCEWIGGRLPTHDEWEFAARGGKKQYYPWGNDPATDRQANFCDKNCKAKARDESADDGYAATAPVGSFPKGTSPDGLLDMGGNVWEWNADELAPGKKTLSGGSWADTASALRVANHRAEDPGVKEDTVGFRCVMP
jgi:formylglycine-generating enzyme required for sulfatase activity